MKKKIVQKKKTKLNKKQNNFSKVLEQDFLNAVENISKNLAYKFKFGYHSIEDMKQQIMVFALEGLKNYDNKRPLENFLWTHVRNRLFNYKRDNYQRPNKPCLTCPLYDPNLNQSNSGCLKFENKNDCELYENWTKNNCSKKNLMYFSTIEELKDYSNVFFDNSLNLFDNIEIINFLKENLTDEYRVIFLKIKEGTKVTKIEKDKLLEKIKSIIKF
jgi:hypothetical protein